VTTKQPVRRPSLALSLGISMVLVLATCAPGMAQSSGSSCASAVERWTRITQQLEEKINELNKIQQVPVERIVQRPLLEGPPGKTMAQRISDALQVKDDLINVKRRECHDVLALEGQLFSDAESCLSEGRDSRNKDAKKLLKHRSALVEKAAMALADVKEVEGKETGMPYSEVMRDPQNGNRGGPNGYWQSYQQMYRRWWGY
jgi:hypothetical protein